MGKGLMNPSAEFNATTGLMFRKFGHLNLGFVLPACAKPLRRRQAIRY
jgi:hypothetical protein